MAEDSRSQEQEKGESLGAKIADKSYEWLAKFGSTEGTEPGHFITKGWPLMGIFLGGLTAVGSITYIIDDPAKAIGIGLVSAGSFITAVGGVALHDASMNAHSKAVYEGRLDIYTNKWKPKKTNK